MGVDYRCNQQTNCSILASTNVFGDPCPGTLKYLEAHYQCVPGKRHFLGSLGGEAAMTVIRSQWRMLQSRSNLSWDGNWFQPC